MPELTSRRPTTEQLHPRASGLDELPGAEILSILWESQVDAVQAIRSALPALEHGANAMVDALRSGGNLVYAAAGSSGLQSLADGLEIPPTFGVPENRIHIRRAGGFDDMTRPKEGAEDDAVAAAQDAEVIGENDCVICLAASGNTIYAVTVLEIAKARGATTIGISNNPDTKLLAGADIPVLLPTPPEVIAGSTRLGAGTAQKIALNMMSTLMGIRMGHVMDGRMVNVATSNVKLRGRATKIVSDIAGCDLATAERSLDAANWQVKEAILITNGARDLAEAENFLEEAGQNLRLALANLNSGPAPKTAR